MSALYRKQKLNYSNISITGYRAIKILIMLIDKPCSHLEIINALKEDEITKKSVSDDTLRITLNSLKTVGCDISRPSPKNNYKYILNSHPFNIKFSQKQISVLIKIRKEFLNKKDWKKVIEINDLYDKLANISNDEETKNLLNYQRPFLKIKQDILKILKTENLEKKEIIFTYNTTPKKTEVINVRTDSVFCDSGRIYILGWYYKRQSYSYFNAEKILAIHDIKPISDKSNHQEFSKAIFKVFGEDIKTFICSPNEKIIFKNKEYMLVESLVKSEFRFFQQLLSLGSNFELLEPLDLKQKLANKISKMLERYSQ
ncbi:WYL domain-containing protein [bacterium]|nr:WYL domain-containing protein [bacterium]